MAGASANARPDLTRQRRRDPVVEAVAEVVAPEVVDAQVAEVIEAAPAAEGEAPRPRAQGGGEDAERFQSFQEFQEFQRKVFRTELNLWNVWNVWNRWHLYFRAVASTYTAKDITVLEGLEPVRKRPGMYIGGVGSTGLHHLVWETLDNSIDEAMNGHASNIRVTLHKDGSSITIEDDGRGIPVDVHPKTKKSALEVIFTVLHAGGKFEAGNYKTAGGLHGVGASVVNALSRELVATVRRDGYQYEMTFKQGKPIGSLKKVGAARGTGTTVFFKPDPQIFPKVEFDAQIIRERLEIASYLHRGVKVTFEDESTGQKDVFQHEEGLVDYLKKIVGDRNIKPVHEAPFTLEKENGVKIEFVMQWTEATEENLRSYVNGIPTGSGGTHENGLRAGHRQGGPQLHRYAQPLAEGRDADGGRYSRGDDRHPVGVRPGAAVPGPDQGSSQQSRGDVGG